MVPAGNKAKCLLLVNHTTKTIHHHHHHQPLSLYSKTYVLIIQNLTSHFISQYESAPPPPQLLHGKKNWFNIILTEYSSYATYPK